jgi:hypothetical protein
MHFLHIAFFIYFIIFKDITNMPTNNRGKKETQLMQDLSPLLRKMVKNGDIAGLEVYDE